MTSSSRPARKNEDGVQSLLVQFDTDILEKSVHKKVNNRKVGQDQRGLCAYMWYLSYIYAMDLLAECDLSESVTKVYQCLENKLLSQN